jgi:energy-coupling factor transport system ATP-binding protein
MNSDMIKIENLHYSAWKTEILRGIGLSDRAGEIIALVGPNGAGKTTLLRHINGLRKPASGTVRVNGLDTRKARTSELARTVGFLFQNPDHQIISNRVRDEIRFGLKHTGVAHSQRDERVLEAAASVGLEELLDSDPFTLPRPLRQRVALASVLALRPRILVLADDNEYRPDPQYSGSHGDTGQP